MLRTKNMTVFALMIAFSAQAAMAQDPSPEQLEATHFLGASGRAILSDTRIKDFTSPPIGENRGDRFGGAGIGNGKEPLQVVERVRLGASAGEPRPHAVDGVGDGPVKGVIGGGIAGKPLRPHTPDGVGDGPVKGVFGGGIAGKPFRPHAPDGVGDGSKFGTNTPQVLPRTRDGVGDGPKVVADRPLVLPEAPGKSREEVIDAYRETAEIRKSLQAAIEAKADPSTIALLQQDFEQAKGHYLQIHEDFAEEARAQAAPKRKADCIFYCDSTTISQIQNLRD